MNHIMYKENYSLINEVIVKWSILIIWSMKILFHIVK